jgi:transposase
MKSSAEFTINTPSKIFLIMFSKRFNAKFNATDIDEFVGEFKRIMPG